MHLKLGKINLFLGEYQTAVHHIREATDVLKITHGEHAHIMRDIVNPLLLDAQGRLAESQRIIRRAQEDEDDDEETK